MKSKLAVLFILTIMLNKRLNAQAALLYSNAPHCIFLKGNKELGEVGLKYYDIFMPLVMLRDKAVGFSIDDNIKSDLNTKYLSFRLLFPFRKDDSTYMIINLYFKTFPDTINYYLEINDFKAGKIINKNIPSDKNSLRKLKKINTGTRKGEAYDITDLVFSDKKVLKN